MWLLFGILYKWQPLADLNNLLFYWNVFVPQLYPALWDPTDCSPPGSSVYGILKQEYWSGLPFPSPGYLPNPGIKPRSPTLQAYSLLSEPPGKPKNYHYKNNSFSSSLSSKFFSSRILNCFAFLIYAFNDRNFPLRICLIAFYKSWCTVILLSFSLIFIFNVILKDIVLTSK